MKSNAARFAGLVLAALLAIPASASTVNLFTIGSTHPAGALDPFNNPIAGQPIVTWTEMLTGMPSATVLLSILAEGIDGGPDAPGGGEHDGVFVNGTFVGFLTQQSFYSPAFNVKPGPGALAGATAETTSVFDVTSLLVDGLNTFEVRIDVSYWVDEIEVASLRALQQVPEPATLPLAATGLGALALLRRRSA